jgi:hypothetical protein
MKNVMLFLLILLCACSTKIAINTEPSGANIYIDGEYYGTSPVVTFISEFSLRNSFRVRCEKKGYEPHHQIFIYNEQTTYIQDYGIVTDSQGNIYSGIGGSAATTGGWPQNVVIRLRRKK